MLAKARPGCESLHSRSQMRKRQALRFSVEVEAAQTGAVVRNRLAREMTFSYAIDVTRVPIRLRTLRGEDIEADVFVHPVGHADNRPESVGDRLNDLDTRFLPCEIDGEGQLVRLSSISYVVMSESPPEVESLQTVGATQSQVELWLRSNDRLRGFLLYEAERGEERVSDMLNRADRRFVVLIDGPTTYFVRREAIDRVRL